MRNYDAESDGGSGEDESITYSAFQHANDVDPVKGKGELKFIWRKSDATHPRRRSSHVDWISTYRRAGLPSLVPADE